MSSNKLIVKRERAKARAWKNSQVHYRTRKNKPISCHYCGRKLDSSSATVDHVIPISKGGRSVISNMVLTCTTCNWQKGCRHPRKLAAHKKYLDEMGARSEVDDGR